MSRTNRETYLDELRTALQLRYADETLVADVVRQVESHVADTGEDPYDTFGDPREYAVQYVPNATLKPFWTLVILSVALGVGGGWLLTHGVVSAAGGDLILWGASPIAGIVAGGVLLTAWIVLLTVASTTRRRKATAGRG